MLLLLLLHSSGSILLKGSVRHLETAYGADGNIQDDQAQECSHESHEKACQGVRIRQGNAHYMAGSQTWGKELVFVKQRCVAIGLGGARVGGVGGVVALKFHADGVGIGVLGLVDDGVGLRELSRRGNIEKSILGGRRNSLNDIGDQAI